MSDAVQAKTVIWTSVAIVLTFFAAQVSFAQVADQSGRSPRFAVNLLDYVASDYGGAVANGKIISASEYHEQQEFVDSALKTVRVLPETKSVKSLQEKIRDLRNLVARKATPSSVAALAQAAKQEIIQITGMRVAPTVWPNLKNGQVLFRRNCASCHGEDGHGDGPAAVALKQKPANFFADNMKELSPFKAFNVIRVGVPGTPMVAWPTFTDKEAWDLAYYVISFRHQGVAATALDPEFAKGLLIDSATFSDEELESKLPGSKKDRAALLTALRVHSGDDNPGGGGGNSLSIARDNLKSASASYEAKQYDSAKTLALKAYLDGVEPAEPRLRANDPAFVSQLEDKMAAVRGAIESRMALPEFRSVVSAANKSLDQADSLLTQKEASPWLTFLIASGILLREGFEAVLIIIALLAVIRASGSREAALWVHAGWVSALGIGGLAWIFSGWLMAISGAQRETMEAVTSIFAVLVLLYVGFWLHNKTEIYRWKKFIDERVKTALSGGNLYGLAAISFMAVFREAFETVLFLRAVALEGGSATQSALAYGVFAAFAVLLVASWLLLKYSARLPIRKVFSVSSALMIALAVILAGQGVHSLQEIGFSSVSSLGINFRVEVLGIFATRETLFAQLVVLALSAGLWWYGKRPQKQSAHTVETVVQE